MWYHLCVKCVYIVALVFCVISHRWAVQMLCLYNFSHSYVYNVHIFTLFPVSYGFGLCSLFGLFRFYLFNKRYAIKNDHIMGKLHFTMPNEDTSLSLQFCIITGNGLQFGLAHWHLCGTPKTIFIQLFRWFVVAMNKHYVVFIVIWSIWINILLNRILIWSFHGLFRPNKNRHWQSSCPTELSRHFICTLSMSVWYFKGILISTLFQVLIYWFSEKKSENPFYQHSFFLNLLNILIV